MYGPDESDETVDGEPFSLRMKDLCELTGLPRQAIHFYIQQGLVPEGRKTGRNMAYYGQSHVERIKLIRQLQHERFLPLKAIRAVLSEKDELFSPEQRRVLSEIQHRLADSLKRPDRVPPTVNADELLARLSLERADLDELAAVGLLVTLEGRDGETLIAKDDAWIVELWGDVRAVGFTRDLGYSPGHLAMYEEAIAKLFMKEVALLGERMTHVSPERMATMVEKCLPLIHRFLVRYHETKVRNFFSTV